MQTKNLIENKLKDIDVVVLCGGIGSRIAEVVNDRPKPMAEINHQPFLDILICHFASFGFRRFVLCTGYMSEVIADYYGRKAGALEFIISHEHTPLGTAGSVKNAQEFIQSDQFLVANGDSFCPMDLSEFYNFHSSRQALLSMAVVESEDTTASGRVTLDSLQRIISFEEKKQKAGIGYINAGIYLFHKHVLSFIPANTKYSLEYDLFPRLTNQGSYAFVSREELIDIGTPQQYERAKEYFAAGTEILPVRDSYGNKIKA